MTKKILSKSTVFAVFSVFLIFSSACGLPTLHSLNRVTIPRIFHQDDDELQPFTCGSSQAGSRVRKEIRDLSPAELLRWRTVMRNLMSERPDNADFNPPPSFWDLLVAVHIVFRFEAHNGAYFLPWHRLFLLYLENHIRDNYANYSDFTLPYWDWSSLPDAADPALSTVWEEDYLGSSSNPNNTEGGTPIPNGPFQGLRGHYLDNHPIRRAFNASQSGSMRPLVNASTMSAVISTNWTWGEFSDAVETAHNRIHTDIGGDMQRTSTSSNDPVFYLHHAFIDKVWWERQQLYAKDEYGGDHALNIDGRTTTVNVTSDFVFQFFDLPVNVTFDQECVVYQRYNPPVTSVAVKPPASANAVEDECEATDMMSTERCRKGEELLESAGKGQGS